MKKLPHFYWTKKNISYNSELLSELNNTSGVVLDPFMGSGSLLLGMDFNKFSFIGIDINEMPVKMLKIFLSHLTEENLLKSKLELKKLEDKYSYIYKLNCPVCNSYCYYDRFIFNKDNNSIDVAKVNAKCPSCNYEFDNTNIANSYTDQISDKFTKFSIKNKKFIDLNLIKNSRIAIKDGMKLSHLFSPVNFYLLNKIKDDKNLSKLSKYIVASILHNARLTDTRSQSQFPYWVPSKNILDKNIFNLINKKIKELKKYTNNEKLKIGSDVSDIKNSNITLLHGPSQLELEKLNDNSIDIVFTDPPYFDQVAYSEYLKIWEYFFNFEASLTNEIIVTNRGHIKSDRDKYLANMEIVFSALYKKLKNNGEMLIYFKDSKERNYMDFISLMLKTGFVFNKQKHLNPNRVTYKQNASAKTTSRGDCIIYFDKKSRKNQNKAKYTDNEFLALLKKKVTNYLRTNEKASTGELLDNIIFYEIITNNRMYKISEKRIIKLLDDNFVFNNNIWHLK